MKYKQKIYWGWFGCSVGSTLTMFMALAIPTDMLPLYWGMTLFLMMLFMSLIYE